MIFIRFRKKLLYKSGCSTRYGLFSTHHNRLLFSMALGDLLVGVLTILYGCLLNSGQSRIIYKLCSVIPLFGTMFVSILSVVFITVDRAIALTCPLRYCKWITSTRVKQMIAMSWILPLFITIIETIIYLTKEAGTELKVRNCILISFFLLGFTILIVSNTVLISKVKNLSVSRYAINDGDKTNDAAKISSDFLPQNGVVQCYQRQSYGCEEIASDIDAAKSAPHGRSVTFTIDSSGENVHIDPFHWNRKVVSKGINGLKKQGKR